MEGIPLWRPSKLGTDPTCKEGVEKGVLSYTLCPEGSLTMSSHDQGHTGRVKRLALYIAREERADVEVVEKAAELHDIARGERDHARQGAEIAREILPDQGYSADFIAKVAHCIEAHSFSSGVTPRTVEAKILSDADKLDAIGAIGVARAFLFSGETGRTIEETLKHFEEKLLKLKDQLYTETARSLAERRHRFLQEFYRELKRELGFPALEMESKDKPSA